MSKEFLILEIKEDRDKKKLYLEKNKTKVLKKDNFSYRISPIFPLLNERYKKPNFEDEIFIGFFFTNEPYELLARFESKLKKDKKKEIWFSHGLASIILITSEKEKVCGLYEEWKESFIGYEEWTINNHLISDMDKDLNKAFKLDNDYQINTSEDLPDDIGYIIEEFNFSISRALNLASYYKPSDIKIMEKIYFAVEDMVNEIFFLKGIENPDGASVDEIDKKLSCLPSSKVEQALQQRIARIIQINSALSYVISQGYSGRIPIIKNECMVQKYSLLGVGTAIKAASTFTQFIESIFKKHPIGEVIKEDFDIVEGVELNSLKNHRVYNPKKWDVKECNVDSYLDRVPQYDDEFVPKLVYFSGRLGFRESEFSVSLALQVLFLSNTVKWSIMTLTHEILHSHVRGILSSIFSPKADKTSKEVFNDSYKSFENFILRDEVPDRIKVVDCLRFLIFNYCSYSLGLGSISNKVILDKKKESYEYELRLPDQDSMNRIFEEEYNNISEIMVHVLDYHYFYNTNHETYICLLWESWSSVPFVIRNTYTYILRSILTIASTMRGDLGERFEESLATLKEDLEKIEHRSPDNNLVRKALDDIENEEFQKALLAGFYSSIFIVDMTKYFIHSKKIQSTIRKEDENIEITDEGFTYLLKPDKFEQPSVTSPVSFILNNLKESIKNENEIESERCSCYIFLACSSAHKKYRGDKDV